MNMDGRVYIAGYWGARPESAVDCARRLNEWLISLVPVHPSLDAWRPTSWHPRAHSRFVPTTANIVKRLEDGKNRNDVAGREIPELGFSVGLWNGNERLSAGIGVVCGGCDDYAGLNSVVLDLPRYALEVKGLYELLSARMLLEKTAVSWETDWAVATSDELRASRKWLPRQPVVGWLTYLSPDRCSSSKPSIGEWSTLPNGGCVLTLAPRWEDMAPELIDVAAKELTEAGSLYATQ
jgi:hypothetical protein